MKVVVNLGTPRTYIVRERVEAQRFAQKIAASLVNLEKLATRPYEFDTDRLVCTFKDTGSAGSVHAWTFKVYLGDFFRKRDPLSRSLQSIMDYAETKGRYVGEE